MTLLMAVASGPDAFGPTWDALWGPGPQSTRAWYAATIDAALPPGSRPELIAVSDGDTPLALLPALRLPSGRAQSLTTPYTTIWAPLVAPDLAPALATAALLAAVRHLRPAPILTFEALDADAPSLPALEAALAGAGRATRRFAAFSNWHVPVDTWPGYLASRPGALRETIRRKSRPNPAVAVDLATAPGPALDRALAAYEDIYRRSWKDPEPYPRFNAAVTTRLAAAGLLRLFVLRHQGRPVAAQYWTVAGAEAVVLKLAHDENDKRLSPGTVLTAAAIRHLIEQDGVRAVDFGRGDDAYKRAWTGQKRHRVGLAAFDGRTLAGLAALARHDTGRLLRRVREKFPDDNGPLT